MSRGAYAHSRKPSEPHPCGCARSTSFRFSGFDFRVTDLGFRVQGLFGVPGFIYQGFGVYCSGFIYLDVLKAHLLVLVHLPRLLLVAVLSPRGLSQLLVRRTPGFLNRKLIRT